MAGMRLVPGVAVAVLAAALGAAGCSAESTAAEDGEVFAATACMNFVEVYVGASSGEVDLAEGVEKIRQARDLAEAAAARDDQYAPLAGHLAVMYESMGTNDFGLEAGLRAVQDDCEPLLPE